MLARIAMCLMMWMLSAAALASPPLQMETLGGELPVQLRQVSIHTEVSGSSAQSTIEMVFFNPNRRELEGNLRFPLGDGQTITGFALDIEGTMRAAVPVEKAKGRKVFEEIERRQVDPALLEQTQGNNFQLRVYPIPPKGTRTVRIEYAQTLALHGKARHLRVPLHFDRAEPKLDLSVVVHGAARAPQASGMFGTIAFQRDGASYRATLSRPRVGMSGSVTVAIPAAGQPQSYVQEYQGQTYFVSEIPLAGKTRARVLPATVGLLWDSSGSARGRALEAELFVLDRYFKALGNGEVRLVRLRDRAEPAEVFRVSNGNWDALRTALRATRYDGATNLGGWQPQPDVGEYLLFSDGLHNYGDAPFPKLASGQRLYALNASLSADSARLEALAERHGGRLIALAAERPALAADALLSEGVRVENIEAIGAEQVQIDTRDLQQGLLRVAGRLTGMPAQLRLQLANAAPAQITLPIAAGAAAHPFAAQLWGALQIRALEADYELQRAQIRRIGLQFGLATRETSLIVLDNLEDYVRYDIAPPAPYQAAFDALKASHGRLLTQRRTKQLERVVAEFQQKAAWWEKEFPKDAPPKPAPNEARSSRPAPTAMRMMAPPAAPAPASAPASANLAAAAPAGAPAADTGMTISLKKWTPNAPYLFRLSSAAPEQVYAIYLDEKPNYDNSSAFFLDAADILIDKGQRELALRVLSNLAEMQLENRHVLRILGYRLLQLNAPHLAIPVFKQVLQWGEEEPQSFRDLGLAYAAAGRLQPAVDMLYEVAIRPWDNRFAEIELIALAEMNAIIASAPFALDTSRIDARLLKNMPLDLRAVLTWDADNSDMDLWVTDPNGEKSYYGRRLTYQGGRMSRDFTGGYGPEEFSLRHAKPGKYKVEANFYGNRQQVVAGATTLQLVLSTGFGTGRAQHQSVTLRLSGKGETVMVGEFEVKERAAR